MNFSEKRLKTIQRINIIDSNCHVISLPLTEKILSTRSLRDICDRINIMHLLYTIGDDPEHKESYIDIIKNYDWEKYLSIEEQNELNKTQLSSQTILNFTWYKESIKALLWAISMISVLEAPVKEDFLSNYYHLLPPEMPFDRFIASGKKRPNHELEQEIDFLFCYHWCTKHTAESLRKNKTTSIIRERRRALEWVASPQIDWDDISLDT